MKTRSHEPVLLRSRRAHRALPTEWALERADIGPIVRQHPLRLQNGATIHPDGAVPPIRWAVEVDHVTWHGGRFDAQSDKGRDRQARRVGWRVDRVTDLELRENFRAAIAELVVMHDLRREELGRPSAIA